MNANPQFTPKMLKRLVERFRANYLGNLHVNAGEGGPFTLDDHFQLRRGETVLGRLSVQGGKVAYDPPVAQSSGATHVATEADLRHWAMAAWDRAKPN